MLIADNVIEGFGYIAIYFGDWENASKNNIIIGNDLSGFTAWGSQTYTGIFTEGNVFTENIFGPKHYGLEWPAVIIEGISNSYIKNDYRQTGIEGIAASGRPCIVLWQYSWNNLVHETGRFPQGTGGPDNQVYDFPREIDGTTTNRVVGHSVDALAEVIHPGIGQRIQDALDTMEEMEEAMGNLPIPE